MRKHISFTIAATILGLAMGLWIKDSRVETNAKVARADLSVVGELLGGRTQPAGGRPELRRRPEHGVSAIGRALGWGQLEGGQPGLIPGRPSHGCIRLRNSDIARLYRLVPRGTPLHII